jgi:hypothetical protein
MRFAMSKHPFLGKRMVSTKSLDFIGTLFYYAKNVIKQPSAPDDVNFFE